MKIEKSINNIDLLHILSFYNVLGIVKASKVLCKKLEYVRSYNIEIIDSKDS